MKLGRKINSITASGKARTGRRMIWLVAVIVASFLVWAAHAPLDEVVRGTGKVVPVMKNQVLQNLEGGIVYEIYVTEGDTVEAGQLLVKLDETRFRSAFQELQDQQWALSVRLARLKAEQDRSTDFAPDPELLRLAGDHADSEIQLFRARRDELRSNVANLDEALALKIREVEMLRSMAERSAVPEIDLIRSQEAAVDVQSRLAAIVTEFETSRTQEYSEVLTNLRQVEEQLRGREDQLARTDVISPIHGIVNKVSATTIGGVVQPGEPLLEILSLEDQLRVEGRIDPRDIGFVYAGMPASIKLTAFDFSIYGTLSGEVVHVGADTVVDENDREQRPYYEVFIELQSITLEGSTDAVDIRPGMQAQIELLSGQKTVLQYLLKPLFKTTEALSER
ncbi:HlyD family efflux transporter periplasmic adaptor subunit [bacterium]|nr:HlyD family efflux transporter periplasmic adaptor subunit [bacterium]